MFLQQIKKTPHQRIGGDKFALYFTAGARPCPTKSNYLDFLIADYGGCQQKRVIILIIYDENISSNHQIHNLQYGK